MKNGSTMFLVIVVLIVGALAKERYAADPLDTYLSRLDQRQEATKPEGVRFIQGADPEENDRLKQIRWSCRDYRIVINNVRTSLDAMAPGADTDVVRSARESVLDAQVANEPDPTLVRDLYAMDLAESGGVVSHVIQNAMKTAVSSGDITANCLVAVTDSDDPHSSYYALLSPAGDFILGLEDKVAYAWKDVDRSSWTFNLLVMNDLMPGESTTVKDMKWANIVPPDSGQGDQAWKGVWDNMRRLATDPSVTGSVN